MKVSRIVQSQSRPGVVAVILYFRLELEERQQVPRLLTSSVVEGSLTRQPANRPTQEAED